MPYIPLRERERVKKIVSNSLAEAQFYPGPGKIMDMKSGELNYIITEILLGFLGPEPDYDRFNEIIGVLECCKLEFYRRKVVRYEKAKKELNGDVY